MSHIIPCSKLLNGLPDCSTHPKVGCWYSWSVARFIDRPESLGSVWLPATDPPKEGDTIQLFDGRTWEITHIPSPILQIYVRPLSDHDPSPAELEYRRRMRGHAADPSPEQVMDVSKKIAWFARIPDVDKCAELLAKYAKDFPYRL